MPTTQALKYRVIARLGSTVSFSISQPKPSMAASADRGGKDHDFFPWHDVEACVEGAAAWDFWKGYEQHWRYQLPERAPSLMKLDQARSPLLPNHAAR